MAPGAATRSPVLRCVFQGRGSRSRPVGSIGVIGLPSTDGVAARSVALSAPAVVLVVAASYATVSQGAFYAYQFRVLVALVILSIALLAARRRALWVGGHPMPVMLAVLAAVAGVSGWSAGSPARAVPTVVLIGVLWAVFVVARETDAAEREALGTAVVVLGVLVAVTGTAGAVLRRTPLALVDGGLWRAASTLTYANASAGFLLLATFLALGRVVQGRRSAPRSLVAYVLVVGLLATLSRGGCVAFVIGVLAFAATTGLRALAARTWPVFAGAAVAALGILPALPERVPARPGIAAATVAAGAALVLVGRRRGAAPVVALLAAAAVAWGVGAGFDLGTDVTSARLTSGSPDRVDGWGAAFDVFAERPMLGAGPGNAAYAYVDEEGASLVTRFVHNEYLQLLAETGLSGIAVVLAGLALTLRRMATSSGRRTATGAGAFAGVAAFSVHSGLDFLWHIPALPIAAMLLIGITADRGVRSGNQPAVHASDRLPTR